MKLLHRKHNQYLSLLFLNIFILFSQHLIAADDLERYFLLTKGNYTVRAECLITVHDMSPDWPKILLAGLIYASKNAETGSELEVVIPEQDGRSRIYSVSLKDFNNFIDDRISLNDLLRKMRMRVK
jgi:hypothetical protein